jgi:hypothetical protein
MLTRIIQMVQPSENVSAREIPRAAGTKAMVAVAVIAVVVVV